MKFRTKGFTLIELMITVAIVAILATIAIPNYNDYVRRTRRNEAREAVMATASALEKFFLNNYAYTVTIGPGGLLGTGLEQDGANWRTRNGFYVVTIGNDGAAPTPGNWTVTATASGTQVADTDCRTFTYPLNGPRTAADADDADNTAECWQ